MTSPDPSLGPRTADPPRGIAVFGSGTAASDESPYRLALEVGHAAASLGLPVITGGYGGVMEAASRGARMAGGETIGVTCGLWRGRTPNAFVSLEIEEPDLFARTARLFALARGFVVLAGGAGTLAELAMLWAHARAGALPGPIVLLDEGWAALMRRLADEGRLEASALAATVLAADATDAARRAGGATGDVVST